MRWVRTKPRAGTPPHPGRSVQDACAYAGFINFVFWLLRLHFDLLQVRARSESCESILLDRQAENNKLDFRSGRSSTHLMKGKNRELERPRGGLSMTKHPHCSGQSGRTSEQKSLFAQSQALCWAIKDVGWPKLRRELNRMTLRACRSSQCMLRGRGQSF